jgi:hypothetical protein
MGEIANPFGGEKPPASIHIRPAERTAARRTEREIAERQRIEKERETILETAHQKATELFQEEGIIDPLSLQAYDQEMVRADMAYVRRIEAKFREQNRKDPNYSERKQKLALILEAIIHEQVELSDWLGPNVTTQKTSRFDDIVNGVDTIVDFGTDPTGWNPILAIDTTYTKTLDSKIQKIKESIDRGILTSIKYFESSDRTYEESLSQVPRVVIAIDPAKILDLARLWLKREHKTLAEHPIQIQILEEIMLQLRVFHQYARQQGQFEVARIIETDFRLVQGILGEPKKQKLAHRPESRTYIDQDRIYQILQSNMRIFQT